MKQIIGAVLAIMLAGCGEDVEEHTPLSADDDPEIREAINMFCEMEGWEINSDECRDLEYQLRPDNDFPPDDTPRRASPQQATIAADCETQAQSLAIGLCVSRTMHFFDGRSELNATTETQKLPQSCEPYHASTIMEGYEVASTLISEHAGEMTVSESSIYSSCAARLM